MWTKPYGMNEGFLIGGGLIIAGLMLELSIGPVDWNAFRWPVNGIVLAGFLAFIAIIFLLRKKMHGLQFMGTYKAAIPALVYAVILTIIMGLTRQTVDGVWLNNMLSFWPFVLIYVYIAVILGLTVLRQLKSWAAAKCSMFNVLPFVLVPRHDYCHIRQCRHAATEDDYGEGRTRMACADSETADRGDAPRHRTEGVYHGDLR